ncbi:hypothetical protein IQ260_14915 [Leptolyngbya cf. ectocarpi LEGE 11479]|uniref:Uncharacterized protein n=1 Tax=Leptolyngbya cf. ectocarpi LEGE 11479 TaxID=1828722 RepID=A0A929FAF5_LEPEC|nr:hypothetical protein [Leptolyngbya ectocarpi]MBE9067943.1 hypothetical protein [Leptolyngbya cf. ectocarpi LEGE 11479]
MKTNSDADSKGQYLVLMTTSISAQLLIQPAFAHENHHGMEEPSSSSTESAPATTTDGDDPSNEGEKPSELTTETVAAPTAQTPTSQGQLSDEFSIGLGESLLGLILVGPFLLMSLKRMCN